MVPTYGMIKELTESNFYEVIDGSNNVLVQFYAPWCGHCRLMEEHYEDLAKLYKPVANTIIARIDADQYRSVRDKFEVNGYPTIKFFPRGAKIPSDTYMGERDAETMVKYLNSQTGNAVKYLKPARKTVDLDDNSLQTLTLDSGMFMLINFYAPWCSHCKRLMPEFERVAVAFRHESSVSSVCLGLSVIRCKVVIAKFNADSNLELAKKHGVESYPTIKLYSNASKGGIVYDGGRDAESMIDFVNRHAGTLRKLGGGLREEAGIVASLDRHVEDFLRDRDPKQEAPHAQDGSYYIHLMQRVLERGEEFVKEERERLARVASGSLTPRKLTEMHKKLHVLDEFLAKLEGRKQGE
ncbi:hypothetical protein GUITHDRAFT_102326 [Guillardia theta CCMP2712]|uniref:protein disulfide-isomerase n=1 Tax=Guillardia theta (strain CCMP2712) TaxID=905079 RepID=L1JT26_GUITC|nr:hypothetical protein GUITHDRAFT_102326 [Guillardia theta CCMP2712]EKX51721.1 hypothetical protein GUITHDRAFT_102326 [Guillardia theta CCMP2712]|eukprot:XP_005838701.1 hypothetical protein GUITHDRAFT_102326 [Guillardia theta CCMP2712]